MAENKQIVQRRVSMAQDKNNLIWLDMEMTGLNPDSDRIIELAVVITDSQLNIVAESPVYVLHQAEAVMEGMDKWNKSTHGRSGLIERVSASTLNEADVERQMLEYLQQFSPARSSPMCGNSICQDRRFMARWMPALEAHFHYRNLDVSTLKELCKRWRPELARAVVKKGRHEALADILESIEEMRFYRDNFIKL